MATEAILTDVGVLYKRLFNHRPVIQNEVHYFVKEFELKREDNDQKALQDAMSKADEINNVFLNDILYSNSHFKSIKEKAKMIQDTSDKILSEDRSELRVSPEEQSALDSKVEAYQAKLKEKQHEVFSISQLEVEKLKKEISDLREARTKMRSYVSSISSSITIYPAADSTTPSPEEEGEGGEGDKLGDEGGGGEGAEELGGEGGGVQEEERSKVSPKMEEQDKEIDVPGPNT